MKRALTIFRNIMLVAVLCIISIVIQNNLQKFAIADNAIDDRFSDPHDCHFNQTGQIDMSAYNMRNFRNIRLDGKIGYFIGQDSDNFGILEFSDFDNPTVSDVQLLPANSKPYDGRSYTDKVTGKTYYFVGLRNMSEVDAFEIVDKNSKHPTIRPIGPINLLGTGPVKMTVDSKRKILYTPNEKTNNISVINLSDPENPVIDDLIQTPEVSPSRIVTISNDVIAAFHMIEKGSVTFYRVDQDDEGHFRGNYINTIFTGKKPYYGEGANGAFFVGNTGEETITMINIENPYNPWKMQNIRTGPSPLIPKVITDINGSKNALIVTNQNFEESGKKWGTGSITTIDIQDIYHPLIISTELTAGPGAGGIEEPIYEEEPDLKGSRWLSTADTPGGTITWFDITDPLYPLYRETTYFDSNSEIHYEKFTADGHHVIASDRATNKLWFLTEQCP